MANYFNYETTAPTDNYFDPKQKKMFVLSYVLIVAFYPHLNIRKIVVQRSYGHSLKQLTTIDYLSKDQMKYIDVKLVKQKIYKNVLGQMFSIEIAFIKKLQFSGLKQKFRDQS